MAEAAAIPIAMAAVSAATSVYGMSQQRSAAGVQARIQQDALRMQGLQNQASIMGKQAELQAAGIQHEADLLELAEKEKDSSSRLRETLASQNVWAGALGIDGSSGSALLAAEGAKEKGDRELSLIGLSGDILKTQHNLQNTLLSNEIFSLKTTGAGSGITGAAIDAQAASARSAAGMGMAGSLLNFGQTVYNVGQTNRWWDSGPSSPSGGGAAPSGANQNKNWWGK